MLPPPFPLRTETRWPVAGEDWQQRQSPPRVAVSCHLTARPQGASVFCGPRRKGAGGGHEL